MSLLRKRKTKDPCSGCGLHKDLCICSLIPRLDLKTRVCLIIHYRELKRTTNTGRLAIHSLVNSEMRVRGEKNSLPMDLSDMLTPNFRSVLFLPTEDAEELNENFIKKNPLPIQLIVPDGNWRQASKVITRQTELHHLERVKLNLTDTGSTHLRAEHFASGMATLQAISYALGIIEGPSVQNQLLTLYKAKLSATLKGRGVIPE